MVLKKLSYNEIERLIRGQSSFEVFNNLSFNKPDKLPLTVYSLLWSYDIFDTYDGISINILNHCTPSGGIYKFDNPHILLTMCCGQYNDRNIIYDYNLLKKTIDKQYAYECVKCTISSYDIKRIYGISGVDNGHNVGEYLYINDRQKNEINPYIPQSYTSTKLDKIFERFYSIQVIFDDSDERWDTTMITKIRNNISDIPPNILCDMTDYSYPAYTYRMSDFGRILFREDDCESLYYRIRHDFDYVHIPDNRLLPTYIGDI